MRPVVAIAGTALRRYFRDRSNYFFVFLFPMLLILVLGLQFGGEPTLGRVAVVGRGAGVDTLVRELKARDLTVQRFDDEDEARDLVSRGRLDAAVAVPPGWGMGASNKPIRLTPGTLAMGQAASAAVQQAVATLADRRLAVASLTSAGVAETEATAAFDRLDSVGPRLSVRKAGDRIDSEFENLGQFDLGASQQLALFVFISALAGAIPLIQSRELRVTQREMTTPLTTLQLIMGEGLGRLGIALIQGLYIVAGTAWLFDVDWGDPVATTAVVTLFCAVSAAAGLVIGSVMNNVNAASGVSVGVGLVAAALGGSMMPLEFFPSGLMLISRITPHHWSYRAFATIQREGGGLSDIVGPLAALGVMLVVLLPLASALLRRAVSRPV